MPVYRYKAVTQDGKRKTGEIEAANDMELEQRLERLGLDLISHRLKRAGISLLVSRKIKRADLIIFCFHLEETSRAGIPLLESLADLRDSTANPRFKEIIASLIDLMEGGGVFSEALAQYPKVFDAMFVSLVSAGETSGTLSEVFANLTGILKWQDELAEQTKKLLMYPMFVGTAVLGVTLFLMIYLVPKLVGFILSMGHTMPFHTRALIAVSGFFVAYWYVILLAPPLFALLVRYAAARSPRVRYMLDRCKLRIWMVGPILKKILLSRFAKSFAMLYKAGIPVLRSLDISAGVTGNAFLQAGIEQARNQIREGGGISTSFESAGLFPTLVVRMLKVGESTGELDRGMLNVSYFYDRDIKETIGKVQASIEPVMTVILGGILGWVMLSVLGPIYDTITKIQF